MIHLTAGLLQSRLVKLLRNLWSVWKGVCARAQGERVGRKDGEGPLGALGLSRGIQAAPGTGGAQVVSAVGIVA